MHLSHPVSTPLGCGDASTGLSPNGPLSQPVPPCRRYANTPFVRDLYLSWHSPRAPTDADGRDATALGIPQPALIIELLELLELCEACDSLS